MKYKHDIDEIVELARKAQRQLEPDGDVREGTRLTFMTMMKYVEFVMTPWSEEDMNEALSEMLEEDE